LRKGTEGPTCPSYLDPFATKEWKRIIPLLQELDILSDLDLVAVLDFCQAFSFWIRASESLMEEGLFLPSDDGSVRLNSLYRIVESASDSRAINKVLIGTVVSTE
jgi:P27 family predicted phage terminase small subunit